MDHNGEAYGEYEAHRAGSPSPHGALPLWRKLCAVPGWLVALVTPLGWLFLGASFFGRRGQPIDEWVADATKVLSYVGMTIIALWSVIGLTGALG